VHVVDPFAGIDADARGVAEDIQDLDILGMESIRDEPEPPEAEVVEVISQSQDCVFFTAERSFESLFTDDSVYEPFDEPYYVVFLRNEDDRVNPTPWVIARSSPELEDDPC
jgi:hypothetical protein